VAAGGGFSFFVFFCVRTPHFSWCGDKKPRMTPGVFGPKSPPGGGGRLLFFWGGDFVLLGCDLFIYCLSSSFIFGIW